MTAGAALADRKEARQRHRILVGYHRAAKAKAHAAFLAYHAAVSAGDMVHAEACFHRFTEASEILRKGAVLS
jgi:hypothetical protein